MAGIGIRSDSHAGAHEGTVCSRVLNELVAALERAGLPRQVFLQAAKFDPELLEAAERRLPRSELLGYVELALDLTQDPAFGLHWAEGVSASTFNLVSQLLAHATSLRQALDALFEYGDLVSDQLHIRVIERGDDVELRAGHVTGDSLRFRRLTAEMFVLGFVRWIRVFSPRAKIKHANFAYPAPHYRAEYSRVFESAERFDQPFTGLIFDRALLDVPSPYKDPEIQSTLQALAERRIFRIRQRVRHAARVRDFLTQQPSPRRVAMRTVARRLEVSVRSLHRRLADEGESYSAIADEASAIVAQRLLAEKRRTIQEAAFEMGFADASSFHRAFKRWTGTTPTAFLQRPENRGARFSTNAATPSR